jgi:copper homeostasis protein
VYLLEIAVGNLTSALAANDAGAHRIELCENLDQGGTTPGYGYLVEARKRIEQPVYAMIRPRGGDFLYSEAEFEVMKHDVMLCRELGFEGIVTGILNQDGTVHTKRTGELVRLARPLGVTFHRAFDRTVDPFAAMEDIIRIGCERILTSGQTPSASQGVPLIQKLIEAARERSCIMPGAGIRADNLASLIVATNAKEYHSSARTRERGKMRFVHPTFGENDQEQTAVNKEEIEEMLQILEAPGSQPIVRRH